MITPGIEKVFTPIDYDDPIYSEPGFIHTYYCVGIFTFYWIYQAELFVFLITTGLEIHTAASLARMA